MLEGGLWRGGIIPRRSSFSSSSTLFFFGCYSRGIFILRLFLHLTSLLLTILLLFPLLFLSSSACSTLRRFVVFVLSNTAGNGGKGGAGFYLDRNVCFSHGKGSLGL